MYFINQNIFIPLFVHQVSDQKSKKGRKTEKITELLSLFFNKKRTQPPRKEYIRCTLLRKIYKHLRSIKHKNFIVTENSYIQNISKLYQGNPEEIDKIIDKPNTPFMDNKTNRKYKSYCDAYCQFVFSSRVFKEIYVNYIEYLFSFYSYKHLSKKLGASCCYNNCIEGFDCKIKWTQLKEYLIQESNIVDNKL
jgi:hypothetical protein